MSLLPFAKTFEDTFVSVSLGKITAVILIIYHYDVTMVHVNNTLLGSIVHTQHSNGYVVSLIF